MNAANLEEKSTICPNCQGAFIRKRKDQKFCDKPECRKAAQKEYQRANMVKRNAATQPAAAD